MSTWLRRMRERPWRVVAGAVGGLLVAIIIAGLVGFLLNQSVIRVVDQALRYDVELEDHGDDLRTAVLDVRHYHRNLAFADASPATIAEFEEAYGRLNAEIDEFEGIGILDDEVPEPDGLRERAAEYYGGFRPVVDLKEREPEAFEEASDLGLERIEELEAITAEIDKLGEERSADSLRKVDGAAASARLVLIAVILGLVVAGAALAYAAVRVVTELRKLYAEQQETSKKLAEASRAKTNFIADASHELRTPLTVLRVNAEVGMQMGGDCEHGEILEEILQESSRMSRLVEDLLFLARSDAADADSLPLTLQTVPVEPFLAELAGRAEVLARERGATFEASLTVRGRARIDPTRIEQAVLILVDNAAKYGPAGGPVTLKAATTRAGLTITVEDRGLGIPEEDLPQIFERFYRVDKARVRKQGGVGLGLPIAKTIVETHGGRIEARSREGEGTRMSLHLPLLPVQENFSDPLPTQAAAPQASRESSPRS